MRQALAAAVLAGVSGWAGAQSGPAAAGPAACASAAPAPAVLFGAYQDVSLGLDAAGARIAPRRWAQRGDTVSWAFATGECGDERWAEGVDTDAFARANVAAAVAAGQRYIVSTGGALGVFSCASDAGLRRFVARYDSPLLAGIDFDVEGEQTAAQIAALAQRAATLRRERPALRVSFTLATHAGADAAARGLNATGLAVLAALREAGAEGVVINLMVMNYGEPDPRWCVPRAGGCDMAESALRAVMHLHRQQGWPLAQIAVTAMLGENDVAANVFTLADAKRLARAARRLGLAGLHHWSHDRDQGCPVGEPRLSPRCHALPHRQPGDFGRVLRLPLR